MVLLSRFTEIAQDLAFLAGIVRRTPLNCLIQVTNRCNMKCSFCDFWPNGAPPDQELSLTEYEALEVDLSRLGRFLISVEGGEPFVRPDLIGIVEILSRRHLTVLYTNGWHVTRENAGALFDAGLVQAGVSIDYPDPRHDAKRGLPGATERAWSAVDAFLERAPHGGRQVHVMTVITEDNWRDLGALLEQSAARGVGHNVTLLSTKGYRRGRDKDSLPGEPISRHLLDLRARYPHFRVWEDYLARMDDFIASRDSSDHDGPDSGALEARGRLPRCGAGIQSFNIDHLGNVSACIEKIDRPAGNVRRESLVEIHRRLATDRDLVDHCQECWTLCRGTSQALSGGSSLKAMRDLMSRVRSR